MKLSSECKAHAGLTSLRACAGRRRRTSRSFSPVGLTRRRGRINQRAEHRASRSAGLAHRVGPRASQEAAGIHRRTRARRAPAGVVRKTLGNRNRAGRRYLSVAFGCACARAHPAATPSPPPPNSSRCSGVQRAFAGLSTRPCGGTRGIGRSRLRPKPRLRHESLHAPSPPRSAAA